MVTTQPNQYQSCVAILIISFGRLTLHLQVQHTAVNLEKRSRKHPWTSCASLNLQPHGLELGNETRFHLLHERNPILGDGVHEARSSELVETETIWVGPVSQSADDEALGFEADLRALFPLYMSLLNDIGERRAGRKRLLEDIVMAWAIETIFSVDRDG